MRVSVVIPVFEDRVLLREHLPGDWDELFVVDASREDPVEAGDLPPGAVVGLSGGIDSAVTAHLAAEALGAERVLGVLMPGPFSSEHSVSDAEALGRTFSPRSTTGAGSTDMANISLLMPTIHPMLGIECGDAVNHQPEFAAYCKEPSADRAMLDGAIAMAQTVVDTATSVGVRDRLMSVGDTTYSGRDEYPWSF